jgi:hypothetical protein
MRSGGGAAERDVAKVVNGAEGLTRIGVESDHPLGCEVAAPRLEAHSAA